MHKRVLGNAYQNLVMLDSPSKPTVRPPVDNLTGHCLWILGGQVIGRLFINAQETLAKVPSQWDSIDEPRTAMDQELVRQET